MRVETIVLHQNPPVEGKQKLKPKQKLKLATKEVIRWVISSNSILCFVFILITS
jgi:hypothetical protein